MSLTNRFPAKTSKVAAQVTAGLLASCFACAPIAVLAGQTHAPNLWFSGSRLIFTDSRPHADDIAVSIHDPGLQKFLAKLGASVSFQLGQRYVIFTAADRRSIAFSIGSSRYMVDGQPQDAPFAAVEEASDAYIPFYTLARALNVVPVQVGDDTVLQPQIANVETQTDRGRTVVIFHGATALHPQVISGTATRTVVRFPGTASTLQAERDIDSPGLSHMSVAVTGSVRNPTTTVTFTGTRGVHVGFLPAPDATSSVLALAPHLVPLHASLSPFETPLQHPVATPVAVPLAATITSTATFPQAAAVQTQSGPIAVTGLTESASSDRYIIKLAVSGSPLYNWHILTDGRFYIDVHNALLSTHDRDEKPNDSHVASLRLRENGTAYAPNVRLAMSFNQTPSVAVSTDSSGITLTVTDSRVASGLRDGSGRVGQADYAVKPVAPTVPAELAADSIVPAWKFSAGSPNAPGAAIASGNNRLIVIDPGHGGSDSGAQHNNLTEKVLTLDIARRLRTLLIARGWQVKMTRDSDVDVYQPNDSAHDELQARCDIANAAGARFFISIHINSFTSSSLQGTTTYYYHPQDAAFANIVESKLIGSLGTQNDGAQHANFYVIHHTTMPAILVETAFLSNPDDAARLRNATFRESVASAISDGVTTYAGQAQPIGRPANDDSDARSSYAPAATHHARPRPESLVRSAPSMDDDLSQ